jgi:hypothetical protein
MIGLEFLQRGAIKGFSLLLSSYGNNGGARRENDPRAGTDSERAP